MAPKALTPGKKTAPISFRTEEDISRELNEVALNQRRKRGEVARLLFEWAFVQLDRAGGSLDALLKLEVPDTSDERIAKDVEILRRADRSLKKSH